MLRDDADVGVVDGAGFRGCDNGPTGGVGGAVWSAGDVVVVGVVTGQSVAVSVSAAGALV